MSNWNDVNVAQLQELVAESKSAKQIAFILGLSRNAIISKCYRTGLVLHGHRGPRTPRTPPTQEERLAHRRLKRPEVTGKPHTVRVKKTMPELKPIVPPPVEGRLGVGPAVAALTNNQCRWPIGAVDADDFRFCCAPADPFRTPRYCDEHMTLGINPVRHR